MFGLGPHTRPAYKNSREEPFELPTFELRVDTDGCQRSSIDLKLRFDTDALCGRLGLDGLFWFYSGCCLAFAIFAVVWVPETQGKSVEDILKAM